MIVPYIMLIMIIVTIMINIDQILELQAWFDMSRCFKHHSADLFDRILMVLDEVLCSRVGLDHSAKGAIGPAMDCSEFSSPPFLDVVLLAVSVQILN